MTADPPCVPILAQGFVNAHLTDAMVLSAVFNPRVKPTRPHIKAILNLSSKDGSDTMRLSMTVRLKV